MSKTKLETVARAHRVLGLLAVDEVPTADMIDFAGDTLDGILEELETMQGLSVPFSSSAIPDEMFIPMGDLLAAEIAGHYGVNGPVRSRAIARIRAALALDDR